MLSISESPLYTSGGDFTCLDGSGVIPFERINDDYCDCNDASDEPGILYTPLMLMFSGKSWYFIKV